MYRTTFVPNAYRPRQGPADESDEDEREAFQGRTYARTPFPRNQTLRGPMSNDSDTIVPGGRPRCMFNLLNNIIF